MTCCVIGGTGFIGTHLVHALVETGRDILVVGRKERGLISLPEKVEYLQGDIRNQEFINQILSGVDEIVNLAYSSVPKTSYENPVLDIMGNLPSSVGLLEAACRLPLKKMLFVSSGGTVYGEPKSLPIDEEHPTNPISPYGITKLALEKYAQMYHRVRGLPVVCVRPSNPFGEGQKPFVGQGFVATAVASFLAGKEIKIFGEQGTIRDYIYVGDVAKALVAALDFGVPGECYNVGSAIGRSNLEIVDEISIHARMHDFKTSVTHEAARAFDVSANVLDTNKLYEISGWKPEVEFSAAFGRTWDWYYKEYRAGLN